MSFLFGKKGIFWKKVLKEKSFIFRFFFIEKNIFLRKRGKKKFYFEKRFLRKVCKGFVFTQATLFYGNFKEEKSKWAKKCKKINYKESKVLKFKWHESKELNLKCRHLNDTKGMCWNLNDIKKKCRNIIKVYWKKYFYVSLK